MQTTLEISTYHVTLHCDVQCILQIAGRGGYSYYKVAGLVGLGDVVVSSFALASVPRIINLVFTLFFLSWFSLSVSLTPSYKRTMPEKRTNCLRLAQPG